MDDNRAGCRVVGDPYDRSVGSKHYVRQPSSVYVSFGLVMYPKSLLCSNREDVETMCDRCHNVNFFRR